jgi:hypothetical protein
MAEDSTVARRRRWTWLCAGLFAASLLVWTAASWTLLDHSSAPPDLAAAPEASGPTKILNNSGKTVTQLHVSEGSGSDWGVDQLGDTVLQPSQAFPLRRSNGACVQDLRIVFDDGKSVEQRAIDLCATRTIVIRTEALAAEAARPSPAIVPPAKSSNDTILAITAIAAALSTFATGAATASNLFLSWRAEKRQQQELQLKFLQFAHQKDEALSRRQGN